MSSIGAIGTLGPSDFGLFGRRVTWGLLWPGVASGEWRVTSGSGEWRVASGEWRVASEEW